MNQYTFQFEHMTWWDFATMLGAAKNNDWVSFTNVLDRLTVGGVKHLPVAEVPNVVKQFTNAFVARYGDMGTFNGNEQAVDDLIRRALGE